MSRKTYSLLLMALPAPCHWADTARLCGSETLGQTLGFQLGRTCKYLGTDREALSWVERSQCGGSAHESGIFPRLVLCKMKTEPLQDQVVKLSRTLFMWAFPFFFLFLLLLIFLLLLRLPCPSPCAVQQLITACGMKVLLRWLSAGWDEGKAVIITVLLTQ